MKILFCRGNSPLSSAICAITKEPVSHVALQFNNFIIHSNLLGVHIQWAPNFRAKNIIAHELEQVGAVQTETVARLNVVLSKTEFCMYDISALLFLCCALLAKQYLKLPLPKTNLWALSGAFLCTEFVTEYLNGSEDSMITPYGLYQKLSAQTAAWKEI